MKYFWNILLQTSRFNQKYQSFMVSNFHICYYQYYSSGKVSPPFIRCLYAVFGYKDFFTTIIYFLQPYTIYDSHILLQTAIYYLQWLYTTFDGYTLLSTVIYYFQLLPGCDFVRIQDFITISCTSGLKGRLDFNINLLALMQFCFFCSSVVSSIDLNVPF